MEHRARTAATTRAWAGQNGCARINVTCIWHRKRDFKPETLSQRSVLRCVRWYLSRYQFNTMRVDCIERFGQRSAIGREQIVPNRGRPERVDDFQHPAIAAIIIGPIDVYIDRGAAAGYGRRQRGQCKWVKRFFRRTAERIDQEQVFELILVLRGQIPAPGLSCLPRLSALKLRGIMSGRSPCSINFRRSSHQY